ncbi:MAG: hypothetical protein V2B14_07270 [bacterium]
MLSNVSSTRNNIISLEKNSPQKFGAQQYLSGFDMYNFAPPQVPKKKSSRVISAIKDTIISAGSGALVYAALAKGAVYEYIKKTAKMETITQLGGKNTKEWIKAHKQEIAKKTKEMNKEIIDSFKNLGVTYGKIALLGAAITTSTFLIYKGIKKIIDKLGKKGQEA